ncbi:hypothetical protein B0H67DRAFT_648863 [Lasiosphaeris hirsuta]|uniref:Uncharacterized protein n=1 Tax=Lasiosphaeris hirsuta TaxID=260670 RepID=A0AA39ZVK5_9PEZI|nr:hypothetical protein B0H67DRAFT_648863 [Lasiosphaeris hirsuta]
MAQPGRRKVYRVRNIPDYAGRLATAQLIGRSIGDSASDIQVHSLAWAASIWEPVPTKTATISFGHEPNLAEACDSRPHQWRFDVAGLHNALILDTHFEGFTPLNDPDPARHLYDEKRLINSRVTGNGSLQFMHQTVKEFVQNPEFKHKALGSLANVTTENGYSFLCKVYIVRGEIQDAGRYAREAEITTGTSQYSFISVQGVDLPDSQLLETAKALVESGYTPTMSDIIELYRYLPALDSLLLDSCKSLQETSWRETLSAVADRSFLLHHRLTKYLLENTPTGVNAVSRSGSTLLDYIVRNMVSRGLITYRPSMICTTWV